MDDINALRREMEQMRTEFVAAKQVIRDFEARMVRRKHSAVATVSLVAAVVVLALASWLSAQPAGARFKAPFEVTDSKGNIIFAVDGSPRGAYVYGADGRNIVAGVVALEGGGLIKVVKNGNQTYAAMASFDNGLGFRVMNGGKTTLDLTEKSSKVNAPFEVVDASGKTVFKTNDTAN
jgi:hypothetical protein